MKRSDSQLACVRLAAGLLAILALLPIGQAALARAQDAARDSAYTTLKSAPLGAFEVKLSEGQCRFLSYRIKAPYPSNTVFEKIAEQLKQEHWKQLHFDMFNESDVPVPERWRHWTSANGGRTHTREEQWQSPEGAVIYYKFWYFSPDMKTLEVDGRHCSAEQLEHTVHHVDCKNVAPATGDDPSYSVAVRVTSIDPISEGYKVRFRLENTGTKTIVLPIDGKLDDGLPHLRVSPQQKEDGQWGSVGNECLEYTPQVWIDVKPGASVESWVKAVDFPEPNKRFGMCTRRIGHLRGSIRVSLRYFIGICDVQDVFHAKEPYVASSEAVDPSPAKP
jgi:hypothetical protein